MTDIAPDAPVTSLPGVGPKVAVRLEKLGIRNCADALYHLPLRYEDRTRVCPIASLRPGDRAQVFGQIVSTSTAGRQRRTLACVLADEEGHRLTLRFFNFYPNQLKAFNRGPRLLCYGEVRTSFQGGLEIVHPEYQVVQGSDIQLEDALTPVYPTTEGLGQATLRKLTDAALASVAVEEHLPDALRGPASMTLSDALHYAHRPPPDANTVMLAEGLHPAQQRLAWEELIAHRLAMGQIRSLTRSRIAPLQMNTDLQTTLRADLGFELTGAQSRVVAEISNDLVQPRPMLRLVHGDVGAGKTVVAALAAAQAVGSGHQCAVVAPTEILAEQHLQTFRQWFEPLGIEVVWLTGRVKGRLRKESLERIAKGAAIVVGTHAVFEDAVAFRSLGLAIVDEQHRFGVRQRLRLRDKGRKGQTPHQLIMTATPIPRTLAMTAYADLDVSVIDELPPGRKPVATVAISDRRRDEVIQRVSAACADGRQVYWVCTLIEESEVLQAEAASDLFERLSAELDPLRVGLVHGRLKSDEKERVMTEFKDRSIDVLVATTVIEVGVDVPNASLMIIENAERLGLSQLHQLRGRVGRGSAQSSCVLLFKAPLTENARSRLKVMRESNDGFVIAQKDLELRGPGEVLGTRQTGAAQFRIAELARDRSLLEPVARASAQIHERHPDCEEALIRRWVGDAQEFGSV